MAVTTAPQGGGEEAEERARGAARRFAEGLAAMAGAAAVLFPLAGFLVRALAYSLSGIPGPDVIALAEPIGQLAVTGAISCLLTLTVVVVIVLPVSSHQPGRVRIPSALFTSPGLQKFVAVFVVAWLFVIVGFAGLPTGAIMPVATVIATGWGIHAALRIRAGGSVMSLVPVILFTLATGVVTGGLGGLVGSHLAVVKPSTVVSAVPGKAVVLGRESSGFWPQECGGARKIQFVRNEEISSVEILHNPERYETTNLAGVILAHQTIRIGYQPPC